MKTFKTIVEFVLWVSLYTPVYFLYEHLSFLSKNVWGTRTSDITIQLMFILPMILIACSVIYFIATNSLYDYSVVEYDKDKVKIAKHGRWFLKYILNNKYKVYFNSGKTYWLDNATIWYDEKGNKVSRMEWMEEEIEKLKWQTRTIIK